MKNIEISSMCNFKIENILKIEMVTESETIPSVSFILELENGVATKEIVVPLDSLEKQKWNHHHPHIVLYEKKEAAQRNIANFIRLRLPYAPKETRYSINRLGTHLIGDVPVFNTGGGVIKPSPCSKDSPAVTLEPQKYKIDIDPVLSERDAATGMIEVVGLSPNVGQVIFSHSLLYIMRNVYKAAWKAPQFSLFLYGETGAAKTTLATFLTQLHNRRDGIDEPVRLNATIAAAETILSEKSDCVVVLDDLFPSEYCDVKVKQEKTLTEITRIIGDGSGRARMKGRRIFQREPTCGVIFTGEYLVGIGSTASRLLTVHFATSIDSIRLRECQSKPLTISTFYHFFIQWYIGNYAEIQDSLKEWWDKYTETDMRVHKRLQETHFFLNTAYRLFLQYCVEKGFTPTERAQLQSASFENLLTRLVMAQNFRVKQGKDSESDNFDCFKLIREWYKSKSFDLARDSKHLGSHDGFKHGELLCLRSEKLMEKIQSVAPSATLDDVRNALIAKSALWRDKEGKNKKIGQRRFYGLYLSKLK